MLEYVELDERGTLDLDTLDAQLAAGNVKLLAVAHVSNVLGTINPIAEIAGGRTTPARWSWSTAPGGAADAGRRRPARRRLLRPHGHKMLGPTGIGALWARRELLEEMPPFMGGGSMISAVEDEHSTWAAAAGQVRGGHAGDRRGRRPGRRGRLPVGPRHGRRARARARDHRLRAGAPGAVEGLRIFGPRDADERGGLVSFAMEGVHPHDIAEICNRDAVAIRAGHHCAQPLMRVPRRAGHRPRLLLRLQHEGRSRPARRRPGERPRVFGL